MMTSISTCSNLPNHFIFANFLPIEGNQQGVLQKVLAIAPFKERLKKNSLRRSNW